jgi:hypothetical protein
MLSNLSDLKTSSKAENSMNVFMKPGIDDENDRKSFNAECPEESSEIDIRFSRLMHHGKLSVISFALQK